jgi:hypothetical protein
MSYWTNDTVLALKITEVLLEQRHDTAQVSRILLPHLLRKGMVGKGLHYPLGPEGVGETPGLTR